MRILALTRFPDTCAKFEVGEPVLPSRVNRLVCGGRLFRHLVMSSTGYAAYSSPQLFGHEISILVTAAGKIHQNVGIWP